MISNFEDLNEMVCDVPNTVEDHDDDNDDSDVDDPCPLVENFTEIVSRRYFAGYILHRKVNKFDCENCNAILFKHGEELLEPSESLIKNKNFYVGENIRLVAPSDLFFELFTEQVKVFESMWAKICHEHNVVQHIVEKCVVSIGNKFHPLFTDDNKCRLHMIEILNFTILILVRKHATWTCKKFLKDKKAKTAGQTRDSRWKKY